jgi:hypothetical protein
MLTVRRNTGPRVLLALNCSRCRESSQTLKWAVKARADWQDKRKRREEQQALVTLSYSPPVGSAKIVSLFSGRVNALFVFHKQVISERAQH